MDHALEKPVSKVPDDPDGLKFPQIQVIYFEWAEVPMAELGF